MKPSSELFAAKILQKHTSFYWQAQPKKEWCGYSPTDINQLISQISAQLGITPKQAELIDIHLEDHLVFRVGGVRTYVQAFCGYDSDGQGNYTRCTIAINRSQELSIYANSIWNDATREQQGRFTKLGVLKPGKTVHELSCFFLNPWENIVWLLTEELAHAVIYLKAQNETSFADKQEAFVLDMIRRDIGAADFYDCDFSEVEASRACLRVLAKLSRNLFPTRVPYFEKLLQKSIKQSVHVTPNISLIRDLAYIPTGFNPSAA